MIILICESDTEAEEFTEWLNANGIGAELTMTVKGVNASFVKTTKVNLASVKR